jgi:uncharacterized protein (TIGR03663 family)
MLTLVLPFMAPFGHALLKWDPMAYSTPVEIARSAILVALLTALSVGIAYFWYGMRGAGRADDENRLNLATWAQLMGMFWLVAVLFFTTFLTNTRNGLATGIVGSLGYWLKQHEVKRGGQPWYYYIMLGWLYEFLPLLLSSAGAVALARFLWRGGKWDPVATEDLPADVQAAAHADASMAERLRQNRVSFVLFVLWWTAAAWLGYSIAGEKMPWLLTHIALPMCVLGGWWFGLLWRRIEWRKAIETRAIWLIGVTPALLLVTTILVANSPFDGRSVPALATTMQWLLAAGLLAGLVYLITRWATRVGVAATMRLLAMGLVAVLLLFTVRFTFMLNYINFDLVTEYLVYAHATPDIKRALREIDLISERTVGGRNVVVAYDDDSSWPLSWYMRLYPNSRFYASNPTSDVMTAPVIIVGPKN